MTWSESKKRFRPTHRPGTGPSEDQSWEVSGAAALPAPEVSARSRPGDVSVGGILSRAGGTKVRRAAASPRERRVPRSRGPRRAGPRREGRSASRGADRGPDYGTWPEPVERGSLRPPSYGAGARSDGDPLMSAM